MSNEEILETRYTILEEIFGNTIYNRGNDEVLAFCPRHHHRLRKLSINVRKNKFRCWVCGWASNKIFSLLWDHAKESQREAYLRTLGLKLNKIERPEERLELPDEYQFSLNFNTPVGMMAETYLFDQLGLTRETIIQNKIGFCEYGPYAGRVVFPSFNIDGELNYFLTRRVDGQDFKKYLDCSCQKSQIIFNEFFINWKKPVILVEAVNAYLKHFEVPNIIPILGSYINDEYKLFEEIIIRECPKVYIALDKEAKNKSMDLIRKFQSYEVDTYLVPVEEQLDEISTNEFLGRVLRSKKFSDYDILYEKIVSL